MERGPLALFGAIVAVGLGPALWLGVQFGSVEQKPVNNRPEVIQQTPGGTELLGGTGAGEATSTPDDHEVKTTPRRNGEPITRTPSRKPSVSPSPSAKPEPGPSTPASPDPSTGPSSPASDPGGHDPSDPAPGDDPTPPDPPTGSHGPGNNNGDNGDDNGDNSGDNGDDGELGSIIAANVW